MKTIDFNNTGDLVLNESFRAFVKGSDQDSVALWKEYILNHPDKKELVETAISIVRTLLNARKTIPIPDKEVSLQHLMRNIEEEQQGSAKKILGFNSAWFRIAAVSLLLIGLSSVWILFHFRQGNKYDLTYNEIIVPLGEKAQVVLSDGTHVWINSASKLRYPVKFGEASRDVILEGEAYFDVTKRNGRAFVVNTRDVKVNVLGTAFNVKCYPGDEKTQTIVVRGMVSVEDMHGNHRALIIKPNEMATLEEKVITGVTDSKKILIKVDQVNPENLVSWKDQMLVFAGESFEDLAKKMERWFNVNIRIDNEELKTQRYNGKFVHNETVYQVLEAIRVTTPISYKINNDTIIISKEPR